MEDKKQLLITASPHIKGKDSIQFINRWVVIALCPSLLVGSYLFGLRAFLVVLISVASSMFFEWGYRKLLKKSCSLWDYSAVITGMLLGMSLGVSVPLWLPVVGSFFAIVVVKQLYGGIGRNFLNPALAGRCFLFSWAVSMTTWVAPRSYGDFFSLNAADALASATPLAAMKGLALPGNASILDCFLGFQAGAIGEVSVIALLIGAAILLIKGVIHLRTPLSYILTVALLAFLFPRGNDRFLWMGYQVLSGGLIMGAFFMATDYTTSPATPWGDILYGVGCGLLTVVIRYFGSYAEGVSFAILMMNLLVWSIDKWTRPRRFGVYGKGKEAVK